MLGERWQICLIVAKFEPIVLSKFCSYVGPAVYPMDIFFTWCGLNFFNAALVNRHLAVSGLTVRLPVWPWQQVCVKPVGKWGVRATGIFIMTSPVYWLQRGGHTQVRLFGPPEATVNWPGRRREEGGSELIAHIRVIQVLPVADNWIDEDGQP